MHLPEQDVALFYKLHPALLVHVNRRLGILRDVSTVLELMARPGEDRCKVRDALHDHVELLDEFADQNPLGFSAEELDLLRSWKHFVRGQFYIFRLLKKHAIFLGTESPCKAYGVCALADSFEDLCPFVPIMAKAVLLPFRDRIVYDGYLNYYTITFGRGIRGGLNESYQEAKAQYGVITTLPFQPQEHAQSDSERLKFYLKSQRSREHYWEEIQDLIHSDAELKTLYYQEMGKADARKYRKRLHGLVAPGAWFAILEGMIVASGKTKADVQQTLRDILPAEKVGFPYVFQVKV